MNDLLEFIRPKSRFGSNMYKGARTGSRDKHHFNLKATKLYTCIDKWYAEENNYVKSLSDCEELRGVSI